VIALATRADISIVVAPSLLKSSLPMSRAGLHRRAEIKFVLALVAYMSQATTPHALFAASAASQVIRVSGRRFGSRLA
jgi:hypothetical protein